MTAGLPATRVDARLGWVAAREHEDMHSQAAPFAVRSWWLHGDTDYFWDQAVLAHGDPERSDTCDGGSWAYWTIRILPGDDSLWQHPTRPCTRGRFATIQEAEAWVAREIPELPRAARSIRFITR